VASEQVAVSGVFFRTPFCAREKKTEEALVALAHDLSRQAGIELKVNASAQAEEERRHQEAQRKRDALADAMKRVANQLTPVSDYFRSGMGTLTGTSTFGAQLALDAALGG
jgi:hypothetical protein